MLSYAVHRRTFLRSLLHTTTVYTGLHCLPSSAVRAAKTTSASKPTTSPVRPEIALTMDDPAVTFSSYMEWTEANRRILDALEQRKLKAALFVCGMRVDQPEGRKLLGAWDDAGHLLCNHSYSHRNLNAQGTSYDQFAADFLRNESIIARYRHRAPLFRYPFLKEGDTAEKRDRFRALLKEHEYRVGHVTIDGSDWYVDDRMRQRLHQDQRASLDPYSNYLVAHLLDRASFYRQLSLDVFGREIRHTLLLHYRMINALFLPDLMTAFEKGGWQWVDAKRAFGDPVFLLEPKTLPAGESLVWAAAAEMGQYKDRLRYPGEDDVYEKPRMDALGL